MDNILVKRKTPFGDYEFVTLRKQYVEEKEIKGFPPHISWRVDNGNSWHFESSTQFLNQSFEDFLEKEGMILVEEVDYYDQL